MTSQQWGDDKEVTMSYRGFESCGTQSKLKEQIYVKCVEYFESSKMYEMSIELCKELQHQHETKTFNYEELANILVCCLLLLVLLIIVKR